MKFKLVVSRGQGWGWGWGDGEVGVVVEGSIRYPCGDGYVPHLSVPWI